MAVARIASIGATLCTQHLSCAYAAVQGNVKCMATLKKIILTQHMFSQGGIDRVCAYLATGFAAQGFETEIIVFCRGGPAESELTARLSKDVTVIYLSNARGPSRTGDLIRNLPAFIRRLKAAAPDAVISSANCMAWITALGVRLAGLEHCHLALKTSNPVVRTRDKGLIRMARWFGYDMAFAAADAVWTQSHAETRALAEHFPRRMGRFRTVINPYVTAAMTTASPHLRVPSPVKQVIAIGRLAPQKRLGELVRAFALIDPAEAHLTLVGDGEERGEIQRLISTLGIADRVTLAGFVGDVLPYLTRADLMVLPSVYEGLPAAVLEAMAVNCPVLATDCFPTARDILEHAEGCGIIESLKPEFFAQQIRQHLAQPKPATLAAVATTYSVENGIANHIGALLDLIEAPRRPTPPMHHDGMAGAAGDIAPATHG
jgi:glycosyltransferase involved in cell wall biosynthesis